MSKMLTVFRGFKSVLNPSNDSWWSTDLSDAIFYASKSGDSNGWVAKAKLILLPDCEDRYAVSGDNDGKIYLLVNDTTITPYDSTKHKGWGIKPSTEGDNKGDWFYINNKYGRENIKLETIMPVNDALTYL